MVFGGRQDDDYKVSKFNPAELKMGRLNEISKLINEAKLNPQAFNIDYNEYNYVLWIRSLNNLYQEVHSKMTKDERTEVEKIKEAIEKAMVKYNISEVKQTDAGKGKFVWKEKIWNIFKKYFEIYENKIKEYADIHGLDSPLKDESSYF